MIRRRRCGTFGGFLELVGAQHLAMRAVAAHLGAGQDYLKSKVGFDLAAELLERLSEELFDLPAAQAYDVRVLGLHPGLVVMLVPADVHEVEFVDEAALFQHLEGSINGDAVELRVPFLREEEQTLGVEVLSGTIDELKQDLALFGEADAPLF